MGQPFKRGTLPAFIIGIVLGAALTAQWWNRLRLERSQDRNIALAAAHYKVNPALIKALVWRESRFNPSARGDAGELGLMQIREDAAREWAEAEGVADFDHGQCLDPLTNLMAGTFYLKRALDRFKQTGDPTPYALAAYNAGRGNALKWMGGAAQTNSEVFIEQIGFPSTHAYVRAVLDRARRYEGAFPPPGPAESIRP